MNDMTESLAQVMGAGARAIRREANVSGEQLAVAASLYGLPWTSGRVGDFEAGRVAPSWPTWYAVAKALSHVTGRPVSMAELIQNVEDGTEIQINKVESVTASQLRSMLGGGPISAASGRHEGVTLSATVVGPPRLTEGELRLLRGMGIDAKTALPVMLRLWDGRTLKQERDRRAEDGANVGRLSRISLELKNELREAIDNGNS